jgi:hypothetical protein
MICAGMWRVLYVGFNVTDIVRPIDGVGMKVV